MKKYLLILLIFPFLLEAQDTMWVYYDGKKEPVPNSYTPGYWRIVLKDGKAYNYPNATFKIQKMIVPVEENSSLTKVIKIYPQPFDNVINVEFELQNDVNVSEEVYNQEGKIVFSSKSRFMKKGKNKIQWDGTNNQGNTVLNGLYFIKIWAGSSIIQEKILIIK